MPIVSLTAVIRAKSGSEAKVRAALLEVVRHAHEEEPGTVAYFVTEGDEPGLFVTHERYRDRAALEAHNEGPGAKGFFAAAEGCIDKAEIVVGQEIAG